MELDNDIVIPDFDKTAGQEPATDTQEVTTDAQEAPVEKDWAKEAQKLQEILNRKDKQLNKTRAEMQELARIKALYEAEKSAPKPPKAEDFTDITDEMVAKMDYLAQKKAYEENLKKLQAPQAPETTEQQFSPEYIEGAKTTVTKIESAKAANPAFRELIEKNDMLLNQAPAHIEEIFFALDNPEAALFELLQKGEVEALYYMQPQQAALHIARAEMRGKAAMQKPVTKASPPISTVKGTSPTRSIENMRGEDLLKFMSS